MAYGDIHISNGGQFPIDKNPMSTVTHAVQIRNSRSEERRVGKESRSRL